MVYAAIAEGYYHQKLYKDALSYAQRALQVNPNTQIGYAALGHIYGW